MSTLANWVAITFLVAIYPVMGDSLNTHDYVDEAPQVFKVSNLKAGDVLNIRLEPTVKSKIVGTLSDLAPHQEVFRFTRNKAWGQINWEGEPGWVSMAYMTPVDIERFPNTIIPTSLICRGTEPFWTYTLHDATKAVYRLAAVEKSNASTIQYVITPKGSAIQSAVISSTGFNTNYLTLIEPKFCSDGMSDKTYGWSAHLIVDKTGQNSQSSYLLGCCQHNLDL